MDFSKLAPWNWFKDEEGTKGNVVPVKVDKAGSVHRNSILDIQKDFDDLFSSLRRSLESSFGLFKMDDAFTNAWFKPSLDISSADKDYTIKLELPGVDQKDIDIEISGNTMKIKGEKKQESEEKGKDFYKMERSYGSFQRVLNLPEDSDIDHIKSTHKAGILTISIPKKALPNSEVKKIEIKSS